MKKKVTFIRVLFAVLLLSQVSLRAEDVKDTLVSQNFDGLTALPTDWKYLNPKNISKSVFSYGGTTYSVVNGVLNFAATSGGGNRGGEIGFDTIRNKEKVYVELDWIINSATIGPLNSLTFYLLGSNSRNVNDNTVASSAVYADVISGIYVVGSSGKFHYWNQDIPGPDNLKSVSTDTIPVLRPGYYQNVQFARAGADNATTDAYNLNAQIDASYNAAKSYHIAYVLNFSTKKVESFTITQKDDETNTVTITDKPFVSSAVTDLFSFGIINTRANNNSLSGSSVTYNVSVDNFVAYQYVEGASAGIAQGQTDKVIQTVNYYTLSGTKSAAGQKGLLLKVSKYTDGTTSTSKVVNK